MEDYKDLKKWAEQTTRIHMINILKQRGLTDTEIKKELEITDKSYKQKQALK